MESHCTLASLIMNVELKTIIAHFPSKTILQEHKDQAITKYTNCKPFLDDLVMHISNLMVHEDVEGAVIIVKNVFPGGAPAHHHPRCPVLGHGEVALDEAVVGRLGLGQPVLLNHLADNSSCRVLN